MGNTIDSTQKLVEEKIKTFKRGTVFFLDSFENSGSNEAVRQALSRLQCAHFIHRLAKGIYLYPKINKEIGILYPSVDLVARLVAKRDKARILPTGVTALNLLGISTQVPLNVVYLTDGLPRKIEVGDQTIHFKKSTTKSFAYKSEYVYMVVASLKEIGEMQCSDKTKEMVLKMVQSEDINVIKQDLKLASSWIRKYINAFLTNND